MTARRPVLAIVTLLSVCICGPAASGQTPALTPSSASAFMGTWPLTMTNPEGARETVRIWDESGVIKAQMLEFSQTIKRGSGKRAAPSTP